MRWLAAQLEDFVDRDSDEAEDDRFIEGAGAVLGLLLIEHLGGRTRERDGCHRVQLGRFGWFDPFAAIEEILDSDDPRGRLSEYLSVATREAESTGPVSRVVRVFADELRRARPDLDIESQFALTVDLNNGATVDLARLERVARDQDDVAAREAARRIISMLPGSETHEATPWDEVTPRLLPRLVSQKFLERLPPEQGLHLQAIGHDVCLTLQLRYGTRARYVRQSEVDAWAVARSLEPAKIRQRAIDNLLAKSRSLRLERAGCDILRVRHGDGLDGARLLVPDLAGRLEGIASGEWLAAAPHRDLLLLGPAHTLAALSKQAEDAAQRAPHPISASLFAVTAEGPRPLQP